MIIAPRSKRSLRSHPDHDLFGSLPGAGLKLAPRLLAEIGQDRAVFDNAQALQCYAGTAPISFQSGQVHKTRIRWGCNTTLRSTIHLWADLSRRRCSWAQVYYKAARDRGKTHACALRCLGQRWLKILWKMWQNRLLLQRRAAHPKPARPRLLAAPNQTSVKSAPDPARSASIKVPPERLPRRAVRGLGAHSPHQTSPNPKPKPH